MNKKTLNNLLFFIAMLVAMSFWGGAWVSAKKISQAVTPDVIVFLRFLFTFISFFMLLLFSRREKRYAVSPKNILWILIPALFYVLYNRLFFEGIKIGLAGKGGVIVTTLNPLFTFIVPFTAVSLSWLFLGESPTLYTVAGGLMALMAIYIINFQSFILKIKAAGYALNSNWKK